MAESRRMVSVPIRSLSHRQAMRVTLETVLDLRDDFDRVIGSAQGVAGAIARIERNTAALQDMAARLRANNQGGKE